MPIVIEKSGRSSPEGKPRQLNRTPPLAYLLPGILLVNLFSSPLFFSSPHALTVSYPS